MNSPVHIVERRYAKATGDVPIASILAELKAADDGTLADAFHTDGMIRMTRNLPVEFDRYLNAVPSLMQFPDALDAAVSVCLASAARRLPPGADNVRSMCDAYPAYAGHIRQSAILDEVLVSSIGVARELMLEEPHLNLPTAIGMMTSEGRPRYLLTRSLGEGSVGEVFLGTDRQLAEAFHPALVAVKVLRGRRKPPVSAERRGDQLDGANADGMRLNIAARDAAMLDEAAEAGHAIKGSSDARHEALFARRIDHPNVVRVLDRGVDGEGRPFIVYEYVPGGILSDYLLENDAEGVGLRARQAATLMLRIAQAVQSAHAAGMVHRDIKPANILMTEAGEPKVTDFGVAGVLDGLMEGDGDLSGHGGSKPERLGNMAFSSPEQFRREPGMHRPSSDVYSLGGLLYFMLTGSLPNGSTPDEVARVHSLTAGRTAPPSARAVRREIDRDLDALVQRAMAINPAQRYASAGEMGADLESWLAFHPLNWNSPSPWWRVRCWVRRRPVAAVSLAYGILIGVALAILMRL